MNQMFYLAYFLLIVSAAGLKSSPMQVVNCGDGLCSALKCSMCPTDCIQSNLCLSVIKTSPSQIPTWITPTDPVSPAPLPSLSPSPSRGPFRQVTTTASTSGNAMPTFDLKLVGAAIGVGIGIGAAFGLVLWLKKKKSRSKSNQGQAVA